VALVAINALVTIAIAAEPAAADNSDARIDYYRAKLRRDEAHYPSHALLGSAYFDKARAINDPSLLADAERSLRRSLEIQPNFAALKLLAATANYRHRFEEALDWAARAAEAAPSDASIVAMRVEAHLALGQIDEARKLVEPLTVAEGNFYLTAARGHVLLADAHRDEAMQLFLKAAEIAEQQKFKTLAVWAKVRAAGVLIDSDQAERARPWLQAAAKLDPSDRFLRIHQIEVLEAQGEPAAALEAYEELLNEQADGELHRRAFVLAKGLQREQTARRHFDSADKLWQTPLDAGEVYTLEGLAGLYCDAHVHLDKARLLAERNLKFKRDEAAHEMLKRVIDLQKAIAK
jgi:tetratricopeptide (TPR) repeat protein